ncbi:hypothetical protein KR074_001695 [Drosophila pseudoananassae]|nr:hypothetical protein KR074_001695 [Drosophila pseudoananassae]
MCCVLQHLLKTICIVIAIFTHIILICGLISSYSQMEIKDTFILAMRLHLYYGFCLFHGINGTLMTAVKVKDLCFLRYWQLMTFIYIVAGITLHLILFDYHDEDFGLREKVKNYFGFGT